MASKSALPANMKRVMASYAGQLTRMVKALAPAHVAPTVRSTVLNKGESGWGIRIHASAPDARAQEYGSGLHSQKGAKATYPIPKVPRKVLAFYWDVANNNPENFKFLPDGRVLLRKVNHPGIHATNNEQGYIRPAVAEFRRKIRGKSELSDAVKRAILSDIRNTLGATRRNN